MAIIKCKMCGGTITLTGNENTVECEYCRTIQTIPRLSSERKATMFDRATHFRQLGDFDKAESLYEQILNEDPDDAESYWSLVLCRFGIQYVEDPATHRRIPTVSRTQLSSVFDDQNYRSAIEKADYSQKEIYEKEAAEIDKIQKGILDISRKEESFDVFICYKETDANGKRTRDSVIGHELYGELTKAGFKVFFSRITLEKKLGSAYEPYIFAALQSAKVMVVICTDKDYIQSPWVRNEWSRFLLLSHKDPNKVVIPAFRDMDPYDLPSELSFFQALDMSKLGFMQDLTAGIQKIIGKSPDGASSREYSNTSSFNPKLKRAFLFIEDARFSEARDYIRMVLDNDPENPMAYLCATLLSFCEDKLGHGGVLDDLIYAPERFLRDSRTYDKALRFSNEEFKNIFLNKRKEFLDKEYKKFIEEKEKSIQDADSSIKMNIIKGSLDEVSDYWDVKTLYDKWSKKNEKVIEAEERRKEAERQEQERLRSIEQERLEKQREEEERLMLIEKRRKIDELERKREQAEKERQIQWANQVKKTKKIVLTVIVLLLLLILTYRIIVVPKIKRRRIIQTYSISTEAERIKMFPTVMKYGFEIPTLTYRVDNEEISSKQIMPGEHVKHPVPEDKDGKHFIGWIDANTKKKATPITMPTHNVSYQAVYGYCVTYIDYAGNTIGRKLYEEGSHYNPETYNSLNQDIIRWRNESTGEEVHRDSEYAANSDVTYKAIYSFEINFCRQNGSIISSVFADYGETVTAPDLKNDSSFLGWSTSNEPDSEILKLDQFKTECSTTYYLRTDNKVTFSKDADFDIILPANFEAEKGYVYMLPDVMSVPNNKVLFGWQIGNDIFPARKRIEIKENTNIKARYINLIWIGGAISANYITSYIDNETKEFIEKPNISNIDNVSEVRTPLSIFENKEDELYLSEKGKSTKLTYLTIPGYISGRKITKIGYRAFWNLKTIGKIYIPSTIKKIGEQAFSDSNTTFDVLDLSNVTYLGKSALSSCKAKKLILNDNAKTYSSLPLGFTAEEIEYAKGTKYAQNVIAWDYKKFIKKVIFYEGLETIGSSVCRQCNNLSFSSLPSTIKEIGVDAFSDSNTTFDVLDLSNVTYIGERALSSCKAKKLILNDNAKTYFSYNSSWKSGFTAEEIEYAKGTKYAKNVIERDYKKFIKKVIFYEGLETIGPDVCNRCNNLSFSSLPSTIKEIGGYAFWGSNTTFDVLDLSNVTNIGAEALSSCKVKKLILSDNISSYNSSWYKGLEVKEVHVPKYSSYNFSRLFPKATIIKDQP